jgi:hypothetical protein
MICRNIGDCSRKPTNGTFSSKMQSKYHSPGRLHTQTKTQTVSVMQTNSLVTIYVSVYSLKNVSRHRREIAAKSDNRVHLVNEIICAMQSIKIYTWEKTFVQLVQIRK